MDKEIYINYCKKCNKEKLIEEIIWYYENTITKEKYRKAMALRHKEIERLKSNCIKYQERLLN